MGFVPGSKGAQDPFSQRSPTDGLDVIGSDKNEEQPSWYGKKKRRARITIKPNRVKELEGTCRIVRRMRLTCRALGLTLTRFLMQDDALGDAFVAQRLMRPPSARARYSSSTATCFPRPFQSTS